MKESDNPIYVHAGSNHPPKVIENIPKGIIKRVSSISATKSVAISLLATGVAQGKKDFGPVFLALKQKNKVTKTSCIMFSRIFSVVKPSNCNSKNCQNAALTSKKFNSTEFTQLLK